MNDFMMELDELVNESEYLASMVLTLEDAMTGSHSSADSYAGGVHLFANLLHNHAQKMRALCAEEGVS